MTHSTIARVLSFVAVLSCSSAPALAQSPAKLDHELQPLAAGGAHVSVDIIVRPAPGAESAVPASLVRQGHAITATHPLIHAVSTTLDATELAALASDRSIASISLDAPVHRIRHCRRLTRSFR